jgi:membrane protein involved in colicin uptake
MKIAALILVVLAALAGALAWTVWRADTAPVNTPPNALQSGEQQLHQQLDETRQHEAEVEKQAWNSMDQLVKLIQWHQHRIDRLTGNSQAAEVVAYDRESIARIQARINDLAAEEKAKALAADEKAKEEALEEKAAQKEAAQTAEKPAPKPVENPKH